MTATAVQVDLFGEVAAAVDLSARWDLLRADRDAAWHLDCCTGIPVEYSAPGAAPGSEPYPAVRCGRCGNVAYSGTFTFNHDMGYCGCSFRDDRRDGDGWLAARHDRLHHADCTCGHPWGWHIHANVPGGWLTDPRALCLEYCGCRHYQAGPDVPALPSRWGTSWTPLPKLLGLGDAA